MRTLGSNVKTLIEGNNFRSVELIEFDFDTSIYLTITVSILLPVLPHQVVQKHIRDRAIS